MKINYHLLLCFCCIVLSGCASEAPSELDSTKRTSTVAVAKEERTEVPTAAEENPTAIIDEKALIELQERKILLAQQLYELYNTDDPPGTYYAEDLAIKTYLEQTVETAEVAYMDWGNGFMLVHADFFNGEPVGGKRFLVHEDQLFGVEIIEFKQVVTESGEGVDEVVTYTFYYDDDKLIQVWDGDDVAVIDPSLERLAKEHLEHWRKVQDGKRH